MTREPDAAGSSLRIASRGSKLALAQTGLVTALLEQATPGLTTEIVTVSTQGDRDLRPFAVIGGKGLFTTAVEEALLDGRADVAVHSAKDLTAELAPGTVIAAVPARGPVEDVVVGGTGTSGHERLGSLPPGARVGTSSMRRRALLSEMREDLKTVELRGNLDTRLRKVAEGEVDAAILAAAGISRLPDASADVATLDADAWVPAPAQGALAVQTRVDDARARDICVRITDPASAAAVELERAFAAALEGGCSVPLGCLARAHGSQLVAVGYLAVPDGSHSIRDRISGGLHEARALGEQLAEAILSCGGDEIIEDIKAVDETPMVVEP